MRFSKRDLQKAIRNFCRNVRGWLPANAQQDSAPAHSRSAWDHEPYWEACERRLALSALPWMPFEPTTIEGAAAQTAIHVHDVCVSPEFSPNPPNVSNASPNIEPHLVEAHQQTGWNQVHSNYGLTGQRQTVAVIDSGIAFDHVALGKGYGTNYRVVGGWDFAENDARPYDDAPAGYHGTHVAGIIGANDGVHFGVASDVDLVALRVFNDMGRGEIAWAENALKWVHENRNKFENPITTVNLSLGANWNSSSIPNWATLEEELGQLNRDGIVVVVSAGNSFQQFKLPGLSYPAASPFVIPVSSIDANGQLSDFSQRDARSIAAPGRSIESTVPDYFYGKDGIANDWANASGTSMAAPYIAGASVLVREAMEIAGIKDITPQSIYDHLKSTANSIWDSVTQRSYMALDLDRAIDSLIPKDTIGDSIANAQNVSIQNSWQSSSWINRVGDEDVFRLNATQSGTVSVQLESKYLEDVEFSLLRGNQETGIQLQNGRLSFDVKAGETVGLEITDDESIGSYRLNWSFVASSNGGGSSVPLKVTELGMVDFLETNLAGNNSYRLVAEHSGWMSVVVDANSSMSRPLQILNGSAPSLSDSTIENGQLRLDLKVSQGQTLDVLLPSLGIQHVRFVNLVEQQGGTLIIHGSDGSDRVSIDLKNGLSANVAGLDYRFDNNAINSVQVRGELNQDFLKIFGSSKAESVDMRPGTVSVDAGGIKLAASQFEMVQFLGGGGQDKVSLYDSNFDDRLNLYPNRAEFSGSGFSNAVFDVSRINVYATQGGNDTATLYDSTGNDVVTARQQFTTVNGAGFSNYVAGFEKVIIEAKQGGFDRAILYDTSRDDVLTTNKEQTTMVNATQLVAVRGFESVEVWATAGGNDKAIVQVSANARLNSGFELSGFQDGIYSSVVRKFERVETVVTNNLTVGLMADVNPNAIMDAGSVTMPLTPVYGPARLEATHVESNDFARERSAPTSNVWLATDTKSQPSWSDWMKQDLSHTKIENESFDWLRLDQSKSSVDEVVKRLAMRR